MTAPLMTLDDLKVRIDTTADDGVLQVKLDDAIDFVCGYLNRAFDDESDPMPNRVKKIIAEHVQTEFALAGTDGIKSESMAGMSQVFESRKERDDALQAKLRATGLRKLRW